MVIRQGEIFDKYEVHSDTPHAGVSSSTLQRFLPGDLLTLGTSAVVLTSGLITGVLAARVLEAPGRGHLAAVTAWAGLLLAVSTFGLEEAATRFGARHPIQVRALLARVCLGATAAIPALMVLLSVAFELTPVGTVLEHSLVFVLAACGALQVASRIGFGLLLGFDRIVHWNVARITSSLAYLIGVLAAIGTGRGTVGAFAMALGASWVVGLAVLVPGLRSISKPRHSTGEKPSHPVRGQDVVRFSLQAHLANLFATANFRFDQAVLFFLVTPDQLGQYAVAMTAIIAPGVFLGAQNYVIYSRLCRVAGTPAFEERVRSECRRILLLALAIYGPVGTVSPFVVPIVFGAQFAEAGWLVPLLGPGAVLLYLSRVLQSALKASARAGTAAIAECAAVLLAMSSLPVLVAWWGLAGACMAAALGYAFACIFEIVLLERAPLWPREAVWR